MTIPPPPPPRIAAICLLEAYEASQEKAGKHYKSCIWNLCKARRERDRQNMGVSSNDISALNVREELHARTVVSVPEPALQDEHMSSSMGKPSAAEDSYVLVDAVKELEVRRQSPIHSRASVAKDDESGLRKRKGKREEKGGNTENSTEWIEETHAAKNPEDRLRSANPLELFGALSPRDLHAAQKEAKLALESYVEAANLAVAILSLDKK